MKASISSLPRRSISSTCALQCMHTAGELMGERENLGGISHLPTRQTSLKARSKRDRSRSGSPRKLRLPITMSMPPAALNRALRELTRRRVTTSLGSPSRSWNTGATWDIITWRSTSSTLSPQGGNGQTPGTMSGGEADQAPPCEGSGQLTPDGVAIGLGETDAATGRAPPLHWELGQETTSDWVGGMAGVPEAAAGRTPPHHWELDRSATPSRGGGMTGVP